MTSNDNAEPVWTLGEWFSTFETRWARKKDATGHPYRVLQVRWKRYSSSDKEPYFTEVGDEWRDVPIVDVES